MPKSYHKLTDAERDEYREASQEKKRILMQELETTVDKLANTDDWRKYLDVRTTFRRYSHINVCLILCQIPKATMVASYQAWKKKGRQVRKGEHGASIYVPIFVKDKKLKGTEREDELTLKFTMGNVFDIAQTDGEPIDGNGSMPLDRAEVIAKLTAWSAARGVPVTFDTFSDVLGCYRSATDMISNVTRESISVRGDVSTDHLVKILLHELAHSILHRHQSAATYHNNRSTCEMEAESVAYCVGRLLNLDSLDYSPAYLISWSTYSHEERAKTFKAIAARVLECVQTLAEVIGIDKPAEAVAVPEDETESEEATPISLAA